ncbi:biopolymer transporter ExbB [Parasulfitobacter algicola]|uniref:Biopolymer transporter ExbB n=1 Tax=Parasulfitobacter algicola TaxID=2614809 RepID=A0ABX2IVG6_9RHOB|nr:biopolymer transporter ExbB [Sulfitobacter algicola]NSX54832.1 biopolymer transporter ExbB [Sulfitobacter algicola]
MDITDREAEPFFSQPIRQIVLMLVSLALVSGGAYLAYPSVAPVFLANPYLNGFIFLVFVIGVLACFWQVLQLISSVAWIEGFAANRSGHELTTPPQLLAPLAAMMRSRGANMKVSASSTRSILDSVATRIDEAREITRYIVNLLIFLGLLGTFYGLATTVPALVDTIRSLAPQDGEGGVQIFSRLMGGLEAQLGGMGVAFASSLLGLAGSLVVGLLELFAGHGQNRFYRELEEWLSTFTRLGFSAGDGDSSAEQNFMAGVLDTMAEQMENMQLMFTEATESRVDVDEKLGKMTQAVEVLASQMEGDSLVKAALLAKLEEGATGDGLDNEARLHLRSIDVQMLKILEELSAGRQESVIDLRNDIATLTQTIRKAAKMDQA